MIAFIVIPRCDPLESAQSDNLDEDTDSPAEQQHWSTGTQSTQNWYTPTVVLQDHNEDLEHTNIFNDNSDNSGKIHSHIVVSSRSTQGP